MIERGFFFAFVDQLLEITSKAEEFTSEPAMKNFLENTPNENAAIWHQSIGVAGRSDPNETAFYYRDAIIAREYLATWTNPEEERENIQWIKELKCALASYTTGDYVNWPDTLIKNWPTAYYGEKFKRLREVKTRYVRSIQYV